MEYLKLFENHSQYENFIQTEDFIKPNVSHCVQENEVHYNPRWADEYFTTVAREDGTISFNIWKSMGTDMITSISYSTDNGETWTTTNNTDGKTENLVIDVNVSEGDKVMWKGDATQLGFEDEYSGDVFWSFFLSTCEFDVQGNVMSLLYGDDFKGKTTIENDYAFASLFSDFNREKSCEVVNAKNLSLPSETLADGCYGGMFYGCTNLTTAPALPATTLAEYCYSDMFDGCTNLTTAPELPATTLADYCYFGMFYGCTSLTTAPELPATTLVNSCYSSMFHNCTSLTTAPVLPATTLAESCYSNMFMGCTNLTTAPALSVATLANGCYLQMFYGCTSLTKAPELPATTLAELCYTEMFRGCTSLNYIKCLATDITATDCTTNWVNGVSSSGTFVKNAAATWTTTGVHGVPTGWTVETASK